MKINIANPSTGAQKMIEVDDEKQLRIFYDRRISDVVDVDAMGGNFVGYQMRCVDGDAEARAPCVCLWCLCWESFWWMGTATTRHGDSLVQLAQQRTRGKGKHASGPGV